jgi:hypothetical protein
VFFLQLVNKSPAIAISVIDLVKFIFIGFKLKV